MINKLIKIFAIAFISYSSLSCKVLLNAQQNIPILTQDRDVKCSGVLLSKNLILTAGHCVESEVENVACGSAFIGAQLIKYDKQQDLALLQTAIACEQPITQLAQSNPAIGSSVFALGCPNKECGTITKGVVSNYSTANEHLVLEMDAKIWFGNSGGRII